MIKDKQTLIGIYNANRVGEEYTSIKRGQEQ